MPPETLISSTTKRHRPSYKDQFPPLDEFEVESSDGSSGDGTDDAQGGGGGDGVDTRKKGGEGRGHHGGIEEEDEDEAEADVSEGHEKTAGVRNVEDDKKRAGVRSDKGPQSQSRSRARSKVVTLRIGRPLVRDEDADDIGGSGQWWQKSKDGEMGGVQRCQKDGSEAGRKRAGASLSPGRGPGPGPGPATSRSGVEEGQNVQTSLEAVDRSKVRGSEREKENTRCNRCILMRRRCDNARPVCGNCAKSHRDCIYEKASVTRAHLEKMTTHVGRSMHVGRRVRRMDARYGGVNARPLFEGFTDEEVEVEQDAKLAGLERGRAVEVAKMNEIWSYADHLAFLRDLDQGRAISNNGLFAQTTTVFASYQRQLGSVVDEWAREQYAGLRLDWDDSDRVKKHLPHGANTGAGVLSTMRKRVGLPPRTRRPQQHPPR